MNFLKSIFAFMALLSTCLIMSFSITTTTKRILIDIGHGGIDKGAVFEQWTENEINRAIAQQIKSLGDSQNLDIQLLDDSTDFISLDQRVEKINSINPDLLISIHIGAFPNKDTRLLNAYYSEEYKDQDEITSLGKQLLDHLSNATALKTASPKKAKFKILQSDEIPSILLEIGNLNNKEDRELIASSTGQQKIARSIVEVLAQ